jgi:hypothetical protein
MSPSGTHNNNKLTVIKKNLSWVTLCKPHTPPPPRLNLSDLHHRGHSPCPPTSQERGEATERKELEQHSKYIYCMPSIVLSGLYGLIHLILITIVTVSHFTREKNKTEKLKGT